MRRIRSIKPELPESESIGRLSLQGRLLFILLFTLADDEGRLRGAPKLVASQIYPYDDDAPVHIESWLKEVEREGMIVRYEANGAKYIFITNWLKHQKIDKPSKSKLPAPPDVSDRILRSFYEHSSKPREPSLTDLDLDLDLERKGIGKEDSGSSLCSDSLPVAPTCDVPNLGMLELQPVDRQALSAVELKEHAGSPSTSAGSADFERFWAAYPRKVGKGAARKAWGIAIKKTSVAVLLHAVSSQRFDHREQFRPHPSTWLNEERWLDESSRGDPVLQAAGLLDDQTAETIPEFLRLN